jgi:hypothetical protein
MKDYIKALGEDYKRGFEELMQVDHLSTREFLREKA